MRIKGLRHFALTVPDLTEASAFFRTFGLEITEEGNRAIGRCVGRDMEQVLLVEGPQKRFRHVSFAVEKGSLKRWQTHLEEHKVKLVDGPDGGGNGLWFHDNERRFVNLVDEPLAPWREAAGPESDFNIADVVARVDRARWPTALDPAAPRRLSHILCFSADVAASEAFYTQILGFRVSDRLVGKGQATFMHAGAGDHHVMAFIESSHPGLHHSSWEVPNTDQIVSGTQSMIEAGHSTVWGLGRHTVGSNMFTYIRDPWGSWAEYTCDMDQVTDKWIAQDLNLPPHVWAFSPLPPSFIENHEPATSVA